LDLYGCVSGSNVIANELCLDSFHFILKESS
jgi:hypothetical protein